jgi:hypothetical protein
VAINLEVEDGGVSVIILIAGKGIKCLRRLNGCEKGIDRVKIRSDYKSGSIS